MAKYNPEIKILREVYKVGYNFHSYKESYTNEDILPKEIKLTGEEVDKSLSYLKERKLITVGKDKLIKLTHKGFGIARESIRYRGDMIPALVAMYFTLIFALTEVSSFVTDNYPEYKEVVFGAYVALMLITAVSMFREIWSWVKE